MFCFTFQIVKIDSGDYGNFGIGTNVDVQKPFLLYASRSCCKVLAASLYWQDSQQEYIEVGQRLVIPLNYPGSWSFVFNKETPFDKPKTHREAL